MDSITTTLSAIHSRRLAISQGVSNLEKLSSSLSSFSVQCKDIYDHFNARHYAIERRVEELRAMANLVRGNLDALERKRREIGEVEDSMRGLVKNVGEMESEFSERVRVLMEMKSREVEEKVEVLESVKREIEKRLVEVEGRERGVECMFGERVRDLERRDKESEEMWKVIRVKEEEIARLEERQSVLEENEARVEERSREVERREKECEIRCREQLKMLESKEKEFEERMVHFRSEEVGLRESLKEVVSNKKEYESRIENVKLEEQRLRDWKDEIELEKREVEKRAEEIVSKEKSFEERVGLFELVKMEFEERFKEGIVKEKRLLQAIKEIEWKEKQCDERFKKIELAKERLDIALLATLRADKPVNVGVNNATSTSAPYCVVMDGKALRVFLDAHSRKEHKVMREVVLSLLRLCSEPGKLVLDAVEGFYPRDGDLGLELETVRISCVLLLETLRKISPDIRPQVKGEAMKFSFEWISKLRVGSNNTIEVAGFLLLIAAYGLANAFDDDELANYAENVAHWRGIPNVCRALGLMARIPGLIRNLLNKKQHLVAIAYILEFNLMDEFPPCSVLKDYVKISETAANEIIRNGNNSLEAQNHATNKRIAALKNAIRCIEYHNIQSRCSSESFKQVIESLKQQNALQKKAAAPVGSKVQMRKSTDICHGHALSNIAASASVLIAPSIDDVTCNDDEATGSATTGSSMQQDSNSLHLQADGSSEVLLKAADCGANSTVHSVEVHCQGSADLVDCNVTSIESPSCKCNYLSAEGEGVCLRRVLCRDGANESVQGEISSMLKSSADPAYLVLDAMKNSISLNLKGDEGFEVVIPIKSCILLLDYLKRMLPAMEPQLLEEAGLYAKTWKSKLKLGRHDFMEVICFLQFITVYNLCKTFDADEICELLDPLCWSKQVPDACQLLGIGDIFPHHYIQNLIENKQWLQAVKCIHTLKLEDKFPLVPLLNDYMMDAQNKADELCKKENNSPAVQVKAIRDKIEAARIIIECVDRYKLDSQYPRKSLEDTIFQLKKQEMERTWELDDSSKVGLVAKSKQTSENQDGEGKKQVQSTSSLASLLPASSIISASNPASIPCPGNASISQPEENKSFKRPRTASMMENPPNSATGAITTLRPVQQPPPNWYPPSPYHGMPPGQLGFTNPPGMHPLYPGNFNYFSHMPMPFAGKPSWWCYVPDPFHGPPTQMPHQ